MSNLDFSKYLSYDPKTGILRWIVNRRGHVKSGDVAGSPHNRGYVHIGISGKCYLAHRIALSMSGLNVGPKDQVDHINGIRNDNRLSNLRIATHAENCHNASRRKDNTSGYKGVGFSNKRQKWRARIRKDNKEIWLGYFATAEEAHAAYLKAAAALHGDFAKLED